MLVIDLESGINSLCSDQALWYAAVAIDAMCLSQGCTGWARGLGYTQYHSKSTHTIVLNKLE